MFIKKRHGGFTLVELLIALTIFALVAVLCSRAIIQNLAYAKKIQAQIFLYSESQVLMDELARAVERNGVDYEAYYARNVQGESHWETDSYGYYAQSFYHPGDDGWYEGPYGSVDDFYGVECAAGGAYPEACATEVPNYDDLDLDMGTHPFTGISDWGYSEDVASMNAFCEAYDGSIDCTDLAYSVTDELILINSRGDERTVFVLEQFDAGSSEYRLSKAKLVGTDTDGDGIVDHWECSSHYDACGRDGPDPADLTNTDSGDGADFMPISPSALNVESFVVLISPTEDPYRAFGEEDAQIQAQVTLILTVTLSKDYGGNFLGELPTITLQRTISTGVYNAIESYE